MAQNLSDYFLGIGAKRLSKVEVEPSVSNQHEFNGIAGFKSIFGTEMIRFKGRFIYFTDNEDKILKAEGELTWYDSRKKHPTRTEYRLYYTANEVIESAKPDDLIIIGKMDAATLAVIIAERDTTVEKQLLWLFGLEEVHDKFIYRDLQNKDEKLGFAGRYILNSLGFEIQESLPDYLEILLRRFGDSFPSTAEFSLFARSMVTKDVSPIDEPDSTLLMWLEMEELLFKTLEKHIVGKKIENELIRGDINVDDFISFSLSVHNRRKSRAGHAFEHHLSAVFDNHGIKYSRGAKTERNNKPDFLFPGISWYHDTGFKKEWLTMLGVKTTAKDRWRQILSEAERIEQKHLITLEPAISKNQTDEMMAQNLQLVLPAPLINTYTVEQRASIINLEQFINVVKEKQKKI